MTKTLRCKHQRDINTMDMRRDCGDPCCSGCSMRKPYEPRGCSSFAAPPQDQGHRRHGKRGPGSYR